MRVLNNIFCQLLLFIVTWYAVHLLAQVLDEALKTPSQNNQSLSHTETFINQPLNSGLTEVPEQITKELRSKKSLRDRRQCEIAVGLGSDLNGEIGQLALINSIIKNYVDSRVLCIFSFSTESDFRPHANNLACVFDELPLNVRIIVSQMGNMDTWQPRIFAENGSGRSDLNSAYNWFRFYLKPSHIRGLTRIIWLDTDTLMQGNVAELYDWNLNGKVVAAATYGQPMEKTLCFDSKAKMNPELHKLKMKYHGKTMKAYELPHHMNAGILVIDLEAFKNNGILEEWHRLLKLHDKHCMWKLSNQPPFTLAIRNDYEELPDVWNIGCMGCSENLRSYEGDACADGRILHWNGKMKPWLNEGRIQHWDGNMAPTENKYNLDIYSGLLEEAGCRDTWQKYDILSQSKSYCLAPSI